MKKLHLGSGKVYIPGFTNVDIFTSCKADEYADVTSLPYDKESFDLIYASHILEHVHRHMVVATLSHWRTILKSGGILRLAVPDFDSIVEYYRKTSSLDSVMGLLYGGQTYHLNRHTVAFDAITLGRDLARAGFKNARYWNWRETDHSEFDDYSQCYLPHMDKESGTLMSLNLEATKP
jgi:ubiquinone/menaquinone biosynthesis C-methylase UbiE